MNVKQEVTRFDICLVKDERLAITKASDNGEWVSHEDYENLLKELEATESKLAKADKVMKAYRDLYYNTSMPKNYELTNNLNEALSDYEASKGE